MSVDPVIQAAYFGSHLAAGAIAGLLGYWIARTVEIPGKPWFVAWMGGFMCWSLVSAATVVVSTQPLATVLFVLWILVGISTIVLTVCFATTYSGRDIRHDRICQATAGFGVILSALAVTGPFHSLYWRSTEFRTAPFPHYTAEPGPVWIAAILFGVFAVLLFVYYFAEIYFRSRRQQQHVAVVLIITPVFGLVPLVLSEFNLLLVASYDHISYAGAVNALGVGYAVVQFGTHSLSTVGRDEVIDHLTGPYIALDRQYQIVDYNEASRVFAKPASIQLGEPLAETFPELAKAVITDTGLDAPEDVVTLTVDGESRHYAITLSELSVHETITGYVLVLSDVTELEASRRQISQQNEQLDAFAGTVSHDLRSPLHIANGQVGLLKKKYNDDRLEKLDDAHRRMETLIDELLVLARDGTQVGEIEPVGIKACATASWQQAKTPTATLQVTDNRTMNADPTRFQQLLENLIRNSVEHGGEGVTVTIGTTADGFYVADDGAGVPKDRREKIFDMEYTTSHQGTGLGLYIVSRIVEGHGWEITVSESVDGGARFTITGVEWID